MGPIFSIKQLLNQSFALYKANFSVFSQLSLAQALLGLISGQIMKVLGDKLIIISLIIALVILYFQIRLTISLVYLVFDRIHGKTPNISEYIHRSTEKIWQYIGANLLLGIITVFPILLSTAVILITDNILIQAPIILIGVMITLFLLMHYFLAPYIVLLDKKSKMAFTESKNLLNPIRKMAFLVTIISTLLVITPYLFLKLIDMQGMADSITGTFLQTILTPFELSFVLLFYLNISDSLNEY